MQFSIADGFTLKPMTDEAAREIAAWQYTGEYAQFNVAPDDVEDAVRDYLDPALDYHAVWHPVYGLAAFCCYGEEAQVPGGDYDEEAIDLGLGLRPDLLGRGLSGMIFEAAMANRSNEGRPLRATVAAFNLRSLRMLEKAGFVERRSFTADMPTVEGGRLAFIILMREASHGPSGQQVQE